MSVQMDLLRKLGSGVKPAGESITGTLGRAGIGSAGFADLLKAASAGEIQSGRPVGVEKDSDLELTESQRTKLAAAADKAELAGSSRVLVEADGEWFKIDVGTRTVNKASAIKAGEMLTGIDAVMAEARQEGPVEPTGADLLGKLGRNVGKR
jgi:hypothetical protein